MKGRMKENEKKKEEEEEEQVFIATAKGRYGQKKAPSKKMREKESTQQLNGFNRSKLLHASRFSVSEFSMHHDWSHQKKAIAFVGFSLFCIRV